MDVEIISPSSSGDKRSKVIRDVHAATMDYGHELNEQVVPAVRIDSGTVRPYYVSQAKLEVLEAITLEINKNLFNQNNLVIGLDTFDPVKPISVKDFLERISWQRFARTEAFAVFAVEEIKCIVKGDYGPVKYFAKHRGEYLIEHWRHRLPTTQANISKKQFFHALLSGYIKCPPTIKL
jgi:hypothetical protein